jgi:uncharacterized protein YbaA (DUF1428 family)
MLHNFDLAARRLLALCMSFFALAVVGCSSSTPEGVVQDFYKAVAANKVDDAIAYFSLRDVEKNDLTAAKGKMQMLVGEAHSQIEKRGGLESVTATMGEQKDDFARVRVELKFKNGETRGENVTLVKDDGDWKIRIE